MSLHKLSWYFVIVIISVSCALEKEPLILAGSSNEKRPSFYSNNSKNSVIALSGESVLAKTELEELGNLRLSTHGWVWGLNANPTVDNQKINQGLLEIDSFQTVITGLEIGKKYYFRPYVGYGTEIVYGPESSLNTNLPSIEQITISNDSTCTIEIKHTIKSSSKLKEHGVIIAEGEDDPLAVPNQRIKSQFPTYTSVFNLKPSTTYTLKVYAINADGEVYSSSNKILTKEKPPVDIGYNLNTDSLLYQGAIVQMTNTSKGLYDYTWSFGDGDKSTLENASHEFRQKGAFILTLEGKKEGCMFKKHTQLTVIENPFQDYWVKIPEGEFSMGCTSEQTTCDSDEKPVHQVIISAFELGKTEITQKQWESIMNYNAAFNKQGGAECPVELVDMSNILRNFIPILNRRTGRIHRLPTEAEWEYAARGGQKYRYSGGDDINEVAWHSGNSGGRTQPVGLKKPNGFGLYDMSGNVWEWCFDYYDPSYYSRSPIRNPTGATPPTSNNFRVLRGGGFQEVARYARVSYRESWSPVQPTYAIGFRLVRVL